MKPARTPATPAKSTRAAKQTGLPGQVVLVLQGGGALGAYQVGVYEAMHEAGIEPDWMIGTSIGAINAALIAGNRPGQRLERLRGFWDRVELQASVAGPLDWLGVGKLVANMNIVMRGIPAFFEPNLAAMRGLQANVGVESASYYSLEPLRSTLGELVDFEYLGESSTRLTVGAVNACTGAMRYFDSRKERLVVDHVMASGFCGGAHRRPSVLGRRHLLQHPDRSGTRRQPSARLADLRRQRLARGRP